MYRHLQTAKKTPSQFLKAKKQLEEAEKKEEQKKRKAKEPSDSESVPNKRKTERDSSSSKVTKSKCLNLTNKVTLNMSKYYGLAIIRNLDSLDDMKKAVW
ncbi:hypothetical protein KPH14_012816 [Odynerus spinipes]|uniref:Uncharacterized protein n=1 Tax=Odynerus spinipes TaxID=1348599 RepID=A0AAD9REE9_9HYME|nr:hypothetical protein KPH14_012816 [Odynerus spinipes]